MIPRLHVVTDDHVLLGDDVLRRGFRILEAGGDRLAFHLRGPRSSGARLWEMGRALRAVAREHGTSFFVNDRLDLALALESDGVHLGLRSFPPGDARGLLPPEASCGASVHDPGEARRLRRGSGQGWAEPDYAVVGALYRTRSHPHREPGGVELIGDVRDVLPGVPLFGIGGITVERVPEVISAGASGVAVVGAVWGAVDPGAAVDDLLELLPTVGSSREPCRTSGGSDA